MDLQDGIGYERLFMPLLLVLFNHILKTAIKHFVVSEPLRRLLRVIDILLFHGNVTSGARSDELLCMSCGCIGDRSDTKLLNVLKNT